MSRLCLALSHAHTHTHTHTWHSMCDGKGAYTLFARSTHGTSSDRDEEPACLPLSCPSDPPERTRWCADVDAYHPRVLSRGHACCHVMPGFNAPVLAHCHPLVLLLGRSWAHVPIILQHKTSMHTTGATPNDSVGVALVVCGRVH